MKYIIKYENFNESKGISDSCEKVLYRIWEDIESNINDLTSNKINFDIDEIDLKCKNITLKYQISKGEDNFCNAQTILKESKIIDDYLTNLDINMTIVYKELDDEFLYYIKSVLLHELLHVFQHYNILSKNKFRPESFSIGSIIPQLRNIIKTNYGKYILDILYYSLSHELSAQIHQYYLHKMNNREYKRLSEIKNILNDFKINKLSLEEENDINLIKKHVINSITFLTSNVNYIKDINKSIWTEKDIYSFLEKFKKLLDYKVKWINKKINLVDRKIEDNKIIKYDENTTLPHNWELYDLDKRNDFIKENLSDSSNVEFI